MRTSEYKAETNDFRESEWWKDLVARFRSWVKAKRIALLFDVDEGSVYRGEAGMSAIRSAYLPDSQKAEGRRRKAAGTRRARRFYGPDAIALFEQMLEQSAPPRELPAGIARLLEHRGGRRRAS